VPRNGTRRGKRARLTPDPRRRNVAESLARMKSEATGTTDVAVGRVRSDEIGTVIRLFSAYRRFYRQPPALKKERAFLAARVRSRGSVVFVARIASRPVGFMQLYPSFSSISLERVWILNDLYVLPKARRRGVGRRLVQRAQQLAYETGAAAVLLETASGNPARKLYESLGWRLDRKFVHYSWVPERRQRDP
jgi:GNAT superfamily N-acetyltransferase